MKIDPRRIAVVVAALVLGASTAGALRAQDTHACEGDSSWTAAQAPFRIHGNTWHVGPRGIGVFLITAPTGHVLVDVGPPGVASLVEANVRRLGFEPRDIKWILISHGHCDHAGDAAALVRLTGAQLIAGAGEEALLARGGRDDPQYGDRFTYAPARVTRTAKDGERLRLGALTVTAHATPGHTKGNTTYAWTSCEDGRCLEIVDVASLSAPGYRLLGNPRHPDLIADFMSSFDKVAALDCDLALGPHPETVAFWDRMSRRDQGDANALIDRERCRRYATSARQRFEAELARQRASAR